MRVLVSILTVMLIPAFCLAQYFVIKVEGKVYANDVLLAPKMQVQADATMRFADEKAYAHVLSTTKGHFILSGQKGTKNSKGEFFAALKDALIPPNQFQAAATRGDADIPLHFFADKYDLKAFFRDHILLTDRFYFRVHDKRFPLDEQHYFELEHQLKRRTVTHRLPVRGDSIFLSPQWLQNGKGKDIRRKIKFSRLRYVSPKEEESQIFGPFRLNALNPVETAQLHEELKLLLSVVDQAPIAELSTLHILPYLSLHYGKMMKTDLLYLVEQIQ